MTEIEAAQYLVFASLLAQRIEDAVKEDYSDEVSPQPTP